MAVIRTSKGEEILIDDSDFGFLSQFKWYLTKTGYARTNTYRNSRRKGVLMHQMILGEPPGLDGDHVNFNRKDNRRSNLRAQSPGNNRQRQSKYPASGIAERDGKFRAFLRVKKRLVHLGTHSTFDLALLARIIGEIRYWGEPVQQLP